MPKSPTAPQRPLSASAVRRILDGLDDLTQGNAKTARAICDLLDDNGRTTIEAALRAIPGDDPREYLRKFKTRFNQDADGAITVVFDGRKGPDLYFTGTDPIAEDIAEYSEHQTYRHASSEQMIDAYAVEEKDPRFDERPGLRIYISFLEEDGELAIPCADLLERTIRAGLKDRYRVSFFRPDRILTGELIDETLKDRIGEADLAIVLASHEYLDEGIEAQRVHATHKHPIIVLLETIGPSASFDPFDRRGTVPGHSFDEAYDSGHTASAQNIANHVVSQLERALAERQEHAATGKLLVLPEVIAERLSTHARLTLAAEAIPARAVTGAFDALRKNGAGWRSSRLADTSHVVERLVAWARGSTDGHSDLCALLGDLGTGKTTSTILLTRRLLELRRAGEQVPLPIYFDLRDLSPSGLTDFGLRTLLTRLLRVSANSMVSADDMLDTIRDEPTLVVFDGLDEVLVHLSPGDGQRLTRSLLEILALSEPGVETEPPRTRLLLSCRTQYFRTVKEEFAFFDGQGRERVRGKDYLVLTLLPFDEDQIREYLRRNVPDSDPDQVLEMIRAVHDLRALASQPVLLDMIRQILPTVEADLEAGRQVRSVDLYERFVDQWLSRDDGKHSLIPEHKIQLMTHLAWQVWRSGARTWSARWMETWMLQFLATHPEMELHYERRMPNQWKQDFRTATFLARRGDDFTFAHSSLLEYFLATRFVDSLISDAEDEALTAWDITQPSNETYTFFAEFIDRLPDSDQRQALVRLEHVGKRGTPEARANTFAYTLQALERDYPHPRPMAINLSGTDLRDWKIGFERTHVDLSGVALTGARLDDAHIRHVLLDRADAAGASMQRTLFEHCSVAHTNLTDANLAGTIFRHCNLEGSSLSEARRYRTQLLHTTGTPEQSSNMLTVPLAGKYPIQFLPETHIFDGHSGSVSSVAWSPDSMHILTRSDDCTARVWDATTGENTLTLTHTDQVNTALWSPDSTHILTASHDGTTRIWDATTGENTLTLTHTNWVREVAWSPNGTCILTTSNNVVDIWDATTGENTLTLTLTDTDTDTDTIWDAAWSPNGTCILTASDENKARVWDATSGKNILTLTDIAWDVVWSPNSTHILAKLDANRACVWNALTGKKTLTLKPANPVFEMMWSPNSSLIITTSDYIAEIWDATTGVNTLTFTDTVWGVAWSPDSTHILTKFLDGTARVWDATTGENTLTLTHEHKVRSAGWSPDGAHILTASDDGTTRIWDATTGENTLTLTHTNWVRKVAWSPNGTCILTGSRDGMVRVWSTTTGDNTLTLTHTDQVNTALWSPDSTHILTASHDGTTRIWDATTGEQVRFSITTLPGDECAVLTPDQTRVIGASPYAWRWLGRYAVHPDGALERFPVEIDGPLPSLGPGSQAN